MPSALTEVRMMYSPSSAASAAMGSALRAKLNELSVMTSVWPPCTTAKEFQEHIASSAAWAGAMQKKTLIQHHVPGADHTLSELRFNAVVEKCTLDMLVPLILHPHKTREIPK